MIKKYAKPGAALAVLLAMLAAPYLTSIDPDSRVFRSSVLPFLLCLAAYFPVRTAFETKNCRELGFGCAFALIFAFFLSIGSELTVYGAFLPGMGSFLRRLAVPVMAAPLLGALFSYILSYIPAESSESRTAFKWFPCFAGIAVCYVLVLLAYFPGIVNYDLMWELVQYQEGIYYGAHPVFHSIITGFLFSTGYALTGSYTLGAVLYCMVQILIMAASFACVAVFLSRRIPKRAACLILFFFALFPVHGLMAVSTVKDAMFAAILVLLLIQPWAVQETPKAFWHSRAAQVRLVLTCLLLSLLRHNGIFAYAFAGIAMLFLFRNRKAFVLVAVIMVVSMSLPKGLEAAVGAGNTPASEMMSVPCQQLMRTAKYADMPEDERTELSSWWLEGSVERYRPHSADTSKGGNFDYERYTREKAQFWGMYMRYGIRYPSIYLEAFLQNCAGIWNPDDISHSHALDSEEWDFVYARTGIIFPEEAGTLEQTPLLKPLHSFLQGIAHSSRHERIPLISLIFRPSLYVYALLLLTFLTHVRRVRTQRLVLLPVWGIVLSYVFSACILVRYAYSFMACVPVMFVLILYAGKTEAGNGSKCIE